MPIVAKGCSSLILTFIFKYPRIKSFVYHKNEPDASDLSKTHSFTLKVVESVFSEISILLIYTDGTDVPKTSESA